MRDTPHMQEHVHDGFVLHIIEDPSVSTWAHAPVSQRGVLVRDLEIRIGGHLIADARDGGWSLLPSAMTLINTAKKSYAWKNARSLQPFFWHGMDVEGTRCCGSRLAWNVTHRGSRVTLSSVMKVPEVVRGVACDISHYKTTISLDVYREVIQSYATRLVQLHETYAPERFVTPRVERMYNEHMQQLKAAIPYV